MDSITHKIKQEGFAENIILDGMWERLCNFSSYFSYIHFGTGTGNFDPARTTLFTPLSYKSATIDEDETELALPISRITKVIRLEAEEFVGETLTEVGISGLTNVIYTHASIMDAEGHPLSITKTDTDIIDIYATIFVTLHDKNTYLQFVDPAYGFNDLLSYFKNHGSMPTAVHLGISNVAVGKNMPVSAQEFTLTSTRSVDVNNRSATYSTRYDIHQGNSIYGGISETGFNTVCRQVIDDSIYDMSTVKTFNLGIGDGETTEFEFPYVEANIIDITLDDVTTNDWEIVERSKIYPLTEIIDLDDPTNELEHLNKYLKSTLNNESWPYDVHHEMIFKTSKDITQYKLHWRGTRRIGGLTNSYCTMTVRGSNDKENWTNIYSASISSVTIINLNTDYDYLYFNMRASGDRRSPENARVGLIKGEYVDEPSKIIFDTPPSSGTNINVEFSVPYMPKDEDHVLDISFTFTFNAGS